MQANLLRLIRIPSSATAILLCGGVAAAQSAGTSGYNAQSRQIVVPMTPDSRVVVDGTFAEGEWDDAVQVQISTNCELYLLADSENLYVGFRLADAFGEAVSEIFIAPNDREFYVLHSSGALGEGINRFSADLTRARFSVGNNEGWESNVQKRGEMSSGKEYRIHLSRLAGVPVKFAGGIMAVSSARRESANFPAGFDFTSADDWVQLILPSSRD